MIFLNSSSIVFFLDLGTIQKGILELKILLFLSFYKKKDLRITLKLSSIKKFSDLSNQSYFENTAYHYKTRHHHLTISIASIAKILKIDE